MINLELLIVITDRSNSESFVNIYHENGIPLALSLLGRGTATQEILDMFSLTETKKVVLFSVARCDKIKATIRDINRNFSIRNPGTSVVLGIPIASIGGEGTAQYLAEKHAIERKEYCMGPEQELYEMIIVITNEGHSDFVMEVARGGGASGGTILHAKGVGMEKIQKFFGISLAEEKEMILIACRKKNRNRIIEAVIKETGRGTKADSIAFSVPVSSVAGVWTLQDEEMEEEEV